MFEFKVELKVLFIERNVAALLNAFLWMENKTSTNFLKFVSETYGANYVNFIGDQGRILTTLLSGQQEIQDRIIKNQSVISNLLGYNFVYSMNEKLFAEMGFLAMDDCYSVDELKEVNARTVFYLLLTIVKFIEVTEFYSIEHQGQFEIAFLEDVRRKTDKIVGNYQSSQQGGLNFGEKIKNLAELIKLKLA